MSGLFSLIAPSQASRRLSEEIPALVEPLPGRSLPHSTDGEDAQLALVGAPMATSLSSVSESIVSSKPSKVSDKSNEFRMSQPERPYVFEDEIKSRIKRHEGFKDHVYSDHLEKTTIGYGHLLVKGDNFIPGVKYDEKTLNDLFEKDFRKAKNDADDLLKGMDIDERAKGIVTEMVFQLGKGGVSKFSKFLSALSRQNYGGAADQMVASLWNKQTPDRSNELARHMRSLSKNSTKN